MVGIYKIMSPSGSVYIGQSRNIKIRFRDYNNKNCRSQIALYASLKKYTPASHIFEVTHELPSDIEQSVLNDYEILYWQLYRDCGISLLNIRQPGVRGLCSEETKKKMSESRKSRIDSGLVNMKELNEKSVAKRRGVPTSEETKAKLSKAIKGRKNTPEQNENMSRSKIGIKYKPGRVCWAKGRKFTSEHRAKLSISNKESKAAISKNTEDDNCYHFISPEGGGN